MDQLPLAKALVYQRIASLQRAQGNLPAAVDTLRTWHAAEPGSALAAYQLGLYLTVWNPSEALPLLIESASQDASLSDPVQVLRRAINIASTAEDPAYGWVQVGRAIARLDQWDLARAAFQQAVDTSPQYAEAWAFLGEARFQLGQSGQAELEKAQSLDPGSILVRALWALRFRRQGQYDLAIQYLQAVAVQEPEEVTWQLELGNTLIEKGDLPAAQAYFLRAVQIAPKDPRSWQALASFSVQYDFDISGLGLPAARQFLLLAPSDPAALDLMGLTMLALEDQVSAERFLQRALEKDAAFAAAYLHLGQLYLQQAESNLAQHNLRQAAALSPDSSVGDVARRLLQRYYNEGGS